MTGHGWDQVTYAALSLTVVRMLVKEGTRERGDTILISSPSASDGFSGGVASAVVEKLVVSPRISRPLAVDTGQCAKSRTVLGYGSGR
jgi:hypothetical protein